MAAHANGAGQENGRAAKAIGLQTRPIYVGQFENFKGQCFSILLWVWRFLGIVFVSTTKIMFLATLF